MVEFVYTVDLTMNSLSRLTTLTMMVGENDKLWVDKNTPVGISTDT